MYSEYIEGMKNTSTLTFIMDGGGFVNVLAFEKVGGELTKFIEQGPQSLRVEHRVPTQF